MRRISILIFLSIGLFLSSLAQEKEEVQKLEEQVLVTASKTPVLKPEATRSVLILEKEEIRSLPVSTVEELLKYASGLDFQQRGASGVQVDPAFRGGTFEQVLILIDGIKITDPQTGHNTLNIPLSLEDVDRIEILKGPGSRLFGPNAFNGVVNIITRKNAARAFELGLKTGQHAFQEVKTSLNLITSKLKNIFSFSNRKSAGYIHNTDFNQTTGYFRTVHDHSSGEIAFQTGFSEKAFGANGFYSPNFPDQWEKVRTLFLAINSLYFIQKLVIKPALFWRHGDDEFLLDRNNASYYRNVHHSDSYGAEITASYYSSFGQTSTGIELRFESLNGNRLGQRKRTYAGMFLEQKLSWSSLTLLFGTVAYNYPGYGWKFWPGLELNYRYSKKLRQYISYNQAFRLPSFTELYYFDPANQGNSQLKPEKAQELETGLAFIDKHMEVETGLFFRKATNLIDWVKTTWQDPWRAENIAEIKTTGLEINLIAGKALLKKFYLLESLNISYVNYFSKKKDWPDLFSKYVLSSLRQQLIITGQLNELFGLRTSLALRYFQRYNQSPCFLLDGKVSWPGENFEVWLEGTNLGNKFYYDAGFLPAPGRWLILGVKIKM